MKRGLVSFVVTHSVLTLYSALIDILRHDPTVPTIQFIDKHDFFSSLFSTVYISPLLRFAAFYIHPSASID